MTDKQAGKQAGTSRRDFLKLAGTSAPAAVAAVAVSGQSAGAATAGAGQRLQKTDHVRKYLESARF